MRYFVFILFVLLGHHVSSAEYSFNSSQVSALKTQLNGKLSAGDVVYLEDGVYNDFQIVFSGKGTAEKPITLKAKNPGNVVLTGKISLKIGGEYLIVDGLLLRDGMAANGTDIIEFRTSSSTFAYNCRLTNTVIDNCNNPDESYRNSTDKSERWIMLYGKNNRVDHCYFTNKINGGVLMMSNISSKNSQENYHQIDFNFFGSRPEFTPGNNAEIIRLGDSNTSQLSCKSVIENNVFYTCNGEVEIISIKSCDNIIRKNVFYESKGNVVCRHGHRNTIESNAFIGNNVKDCGGIRIINEGHRVYNNFLQDIQGTGSRSALSVMMAVFETPTSSTDTDKEPLNAYHKVRDVEICHNTFVNCKNIDLGTTGKYTYSSSNPYYPNQTVSATLKPECIIAQNVFYNVSESSILNQLNDSEITYSGNICKFKKNVSINGFVNKALDFVKASSGSGRGIYSLNSNDESVLSSSSSNFSYVVSDISGNTRTGEKSAGAQQYKNIQLPFSTVKPSGCGVEWYQAQKNDIEAIKSKTDFWEEPVNGITSLYFEDIKICRDGRFYKITSDNYLSDVHVYDIKGNLVSSVYTDSNTLVLNSDNWHSGAYVFKIGNVTRKVIVN